MEIRDPVHGSIRISKEIIPIIQHRYFGRLRNIKQLGLSEYVFPGATHTRFLHSVGVMAVGERAFDNLFPQYSNSPTLIRLRETFKLACLLHDIGHAPLSHATEMAMPKLSQLNLPAPFNQVSLNTPDQQATHEDYTIKSIIDGPLTEAFAQVEDHFGVDRRAIAELIVGQCWSPDYFTHNDINYFPLLHQLVSSEMDCDRMDYLLRDSYFCGVSYGQFDLDWLLDNLQVCVIEQKAYLGISERAVVTFDDFLLSRYHMFIMVYFHYRSVCLEQLLQKFFKTSPDDYRIPADLDEYQHHDDHYLMKIMRNGSNPYAKAIIENKIPSKIYESYNSEQLSKLEMIQEYLESEGIEYIRGSSQSRLSKYYCSRESGDNYAIRVVRTTMGSSEQTFSNITQATDLFNRFSSSHAVNRLHSDLSSMQSKQREDLMKLIDLP